jgi:hypothetical protein
VVIDYFDVFLNKNILINNCYDTFGYTLGAVFQDIWKGNIKNLYLASLLELHTLS